MCVVKTTAVDLWRHQNCICSLLWVHIYDASLILAVTNAITILACSTRGLYVRYIIIVVGIFFITLRHFITFVLSLCSTVIAKSKLMAFKSTIMKNIVDWNSLFDLVLYDEYMRQIVTHVVRMNNKKNAEKAQL